ncbi:MAG: outer membrane beta-barrel protein [Chitinophagaceae bacterium]|nr:outer membrane beta-barrel protein [Chitinophagaceae bacterium]
MYRFYITVLFCLISTGLIAQSPKGIITGKLTDSTGKQPLSLATVAVFNAKDTTLITYRLSDPQGFFKVPGIPLNDSCRIIITHAGSEAYRRNFLLSGIQPQLDLGTIKLSPDARLMEEVLVVAERPPVIVRKDTIEFNAEAFKTLPSALVEDLLRKLPGVEVDAQGNITVNGRKVNKLYVDGKEFFGSDPQMATKNLPANIIDKIQVTDDKEQMNQNPDLPKGQIGQVINLKLKKAIKKGWFGKAYAGAGTDKRYEAGGIFNLFRDTLQVSLLGYTNNINRPGFGMNDIMSTGGFNRSGINSMMVMSDGGFALNNISFGGTGQGIQHSTGAGFNMNNQLGKKVTLNLQYFYGQVKSDIHQLNNRQQFFNDTSMTTRNENNEHTTNNVHRIGGFIKWEVDSLSAIEFRPTVSIKTAHGQSNIHYNTYSNYEPLLNESDNEERRKNNTTEFSQLISYNKKFRKGGRTLYMSGTFRLSGNNDHQYNDAENIFYTNQQQVSTMLNQLRNRNLGNTSLDFWANYNEPVSKKLSLQFNESFNFFRNKDEVKTFDDTNNSNKYNELNDALSNGLNRNGWRSNTRAALKYSHKSFSISPGINYQLLNIDNRFQKNPSIAQQFNYILPSLQINISSLNIGYNVNASEPQVDDLQPVENNTNPLFITRGNPLLKPSINHSLNVQTYKYNMKSNINYNLYIYGVISNNAIIRERTVDKNGVQYTAPVNANGIWEMQGGGGINKQFKFNKDWKFSLGSSMWGRYNRGLIIINSIRTNTQNLNLNPGINVSFNWNDKFEFRQNYAVGWTRSRYANDALPGLEITTHNSGSELIIRMPKHWVWETSLDYRYNPQVAEGIQKSIYRWNAALNFLFLKDDKGQLKLSAFDLLNQNTSIYRTVTDNYINDVETTVLKRYFMLTFTYNIRNFGGKVGGRERLFLF